MSMKTKNWGKVYLIMLLVWIPFFGSAKKNNVTLSDTEKTEVSKQASQYYKAMTDSEKDYTDAKEADVENLCEKYKVKISTYAQG